MCRSERDDDAKIFKPSDGSMSRVGVMRRAFPKRTKTDKFSPHQQEMLNG
jgi:hypothetical protein